MYHLYRKWQVSLAPWCIYIVFANCNKQCEEAQKKANRVLAVLQRNVHSAALKVKECAYQTLVRPITEYASPAWNPHTT